MTHLLRAMCGAAYVGVLAIAGTTACASPPAVAGIGARGVAADTAPVPGGVLHYEASGTGPTVVLVHGGFADRRMWDEQFAVLAREFRVVRYDHRGFGRSPAAAAPYSPVADLWALLRHLRVDRAHLVGNSLGGVLVADFAATHPTMVRTLTIVAAGARGVDVPPPPPAERERTLAMLDAARERGVAAGLALRLQDPMLAPALADPATSARVRTLVTESAPVLLMAHWPFEPSPAPPAEAWRRLSTPTLVVYGDADVPSTRDAAQATAAAIPGARLVRMPDVGHWPQMERPAAFNALLLDFLRAHR